MVVVNFARAHQRKHIVQGPRAHRARLGPLAPLADDELAEFLPELHGVQVWEGHPDWSCRHSGGRGGQGARPRAAGGTEPTGAAAEQWRRGGEIRKQGHI
eukprot:6424082-Pyramimonas_sp.AAC.1